MNIKRDILWRVLLSIGAIVLFGLALLMSIGRIQYAEGDKWRSMGDSLYVNNQTVSAIRGSIYSEDGNLLATSVPIFQISLDFYVIRQYHADSFHDYRNQLAYKLSNTLKNGSPERYDSLLRAGYKKKSRYVTLTRNGSFIQAQAIRRWPIFNSGRNKGGVILEPRTVRRKPYGGLMARTIGFINENGIGAGIEASFNESLAGNNGSIMVRKISGGYRPIDDDLQIQPENGKDIFTTIDIHLQDIVNESLIEGVTAHGAEFGTAILLEVETGKIKAISNVNRTSRGYRERFNHAVGTGYEPGSTIKLLSALATLETGGISPEDSVDINYGKYVFSKRDTFEDSGRNLPKRLTYRQVFEKSSNVGIIKTTYSTFKNKPEAFLDYFDELHLTQPLAIGIKGEVEPSILRPGQSAWSISSLPSLSIGYSFTTSPLHMAMMFNAVANNGVMMRPYLISSIGYLGKSEKTYKPQILNRKICNTVTLETLKSFLDGVVENGTAGSLKDLPFKVAGKTGTSKISGGSRGYKAGQYYSSFIGYFPSDRPKYTLLVLVGKPTSGRYYGSSVAVPVFKQIARKIQANTLQKHVEPLEKKNIPNLITGKWNEVSKTAKRFNWSADGQSVTSNQLVKVAGDTNSISVNPTKNHPGEMPDLVGFGLRHALYELENRGHGVRFKGYGKIKEQSPLPGTKLRKGQVIYLRLGV